MSSRISPLRLEFLPAARPTPPKELGHVLGSVFFGAGGNPGERAEREHGGVVVHVPLDPLDPEPLAEIWTTDEIPELGSRHGFATAQTDKLLFGSAEVDRDDPELVARELYAELFELLSDCEYPHLLRVWNVIPNIGDLSRRRERGGIDRYMQFCRGRSLAFEDRHGAGFESLLPAASAVGSSRGPFVTWFLASKSSGAPRENPRQVSAFRYSERYGPKPPSFARATLSPACLGSELLLSGTASILGSESVHPGDTLAQLRETMVNLQALLGPQGERESRRLSRLKVFVRDRADLDSIREALRPLCDAGTRMLFVEADICRPELLLEIEGIADLDTSVEGGGNGFGPPLGSTRWRIRAEPDNLLP